MTYPSEAFAWNVISSVYPCGRTAVGMGRVAALVSVSVSAFAFLKSIKESVYV